MLYHRLKRLIVNFICKHVLDSKFIQLASRIRPFMKHMLVTINRDPNSSFMLLQHSVKSNCGFILSCAALIKSSCESLKCLKQLHISMRNNMFDNLKSARLLFNSRACSHAIFHETEGDKYCSTERLLFLQGFHYIAQQRISAGFQ